MEEKRTPESLANTKTPLDDFIGKYAYRLTKDGDISKELIIAIKDRDTAEPKVGVFQKDMVCDKFHSLDCMYPTYAEAELGRQALEDKVIAEYAKEINSVGDLLLFAINHKLQKDDITPFSLNDYNASLKKTEFLAPFIEYYDTHAFTTTLNDYAATKVALQKASEYGIELMGIKACRDYIDDLVYGQELSGGLSLNSLNDVHSIELRLPYQEYSPEYRRSCIAGLDDRNDENLLSCTLRLEKNEENKFAISYLEPSQYDPMDPHHKMCPIPYNSHNSALTEEQTLQLLKSFSVQRPHNCIMIELEKEHELRLKDVPKDTPIYLLEDGEISQVTLRAEADSFPGESVLLLEKDTGEKFYYKDRPPFMRGDGAMEDYYYDFISDEGHVSGVDWFLNREDAEKAKEFFEEIGFYPAMEQNLDAPEEEFEQEEFEFER